MREILFRGKRIDNGEWVYGWYSKGIHGYIPKEVTQIHTQTVYPDGTKQTNNAVDPNTVGQYTGLKDKNGVMIYEGDVLRCWGGASHYGVYEFDSTITITDIRYVNWEELNCHDEIYTLGNIHDKED